MDLALNNLQWLICHKNQIKRNPTKTNIQQAIEKIKNLMATAITFFRFHIKVKNNVA